MKPQAFRPSTWRPIWGIFWILWLVGCSNSAHEEYEHHHQDPQHSHQQHLPQSSPLDHDPHHDCDGHPNSPEPNGHNHDHGHDHDHGQDLDLPVEDLLAQWCEHGIETYTCHPCRHEIGMTLVPQELMDGGLVVLGRVEERDFQSEVTLTGEIQFDERKLAHLAPRAPGVVKRVAVDLGQPVTAGQVLVELESIQLAEAQATYLERMALQRLARFTLDSQEALRRRDISSERALLEAQQQHEAAAIQTSSARQMLLRLGLRPSEITALERVGLSGVTGKLPVVAPFDGTILELRAVRGELILPDAEMLIMGDLDTLWVWLDLYESHLEPISRAMADHQQLPVTLTVHAYPHERFSGSIDHIRQTMDKRTRTVKARVILDNRDNKLKPGMFAEIRVRLDHQATRPSVPESAVMSDEGRDFVFVHLRDNLFLRRPILGGRRVNGSLELLAGLQHHQPIVVDGAFLLKSDILRSKMGEGCAH